MKVCTRCKESKSLDDFGNSRAGKLGKVERCKSCVIAVHKTRIENDPEYRRMRNALSAKWKRDNPTKVNESAARWRNANKSKVKEIGKRWTSNNLAKAAEKAMKRHAMKLRAIPALTEDDMDFNGLAMREAYELAKHRQNLTGVKWEVDHRVPLISDIVCGLHYFQNIQVITEKENRVKSNKYWEGMPNGYT